MTNDEYFPCDSTDECPRWLHISSSRGWSPNGNRLQQIQDVVMLPMYDEYGVHPLSVHSLCAPITMTWCTLYICCIQPTHSRAYMCPGYDAAACRRATRYTCAWSDDVCWVHSVYITSCDAVRNRLTLYYNTKRDHIAVSPQQPLHRDVAMRSVQRADTLTSAMVTIWRMIAIEWVDGDVIGWTASMTARCVIHKWSIFVIFSQIPMGNDLKFCLFEIGKIEEM